MEWRMVMKTKGRRKRQRLLLSRKPKDEDVHQEKPRRQHLQRVRMKKQSFHQRSQKERAEVGLLARKPKKRKRLKMMMRRRRMRRLLPRKPMVADVHQAKPRRQQCTRRTVKKT